MLAGFRSRWTSSRACAKASPSADLLHQRELLVERHLAVGDRVLEVLALEQLHRHEHLVVLEAELVDGDDVGMAQQRDRLRLAHEALAHRLVRVEAGRDALDGDVAVQHRVVGAEDLAHGPLAELADDLVLADLLGSAHPGGRASPRAFRLRERRLARDDSTRASRSPGVQRLAPAVRRDLAARARAGSPAAARRPRPGRCSGRCGGRRAPRRARPRGRPRAARSRSSAAAQSAGMPLK